MGSYGYNSDGNKVLLFIRDVPYSKKVVHWLKLAGNSVVECTSLGAFKNRLLTEERDIIITDTDIDLAGSNAHIILFVKIGDSREVIFRIITAALEHTSSEP